jgi:hypothetical protein
MHNTKWMAVSLIALVGGCTMTAGDEQRPDELASDVEAAPPAHDSVAQLPPHLYGQQLECVSAQECDDGNPCTQDSCVSNSCSRVPTNAMCDDANPCTVRDRCQEGACFGVDHIPLMKEEQGSRWKLIGDEGGVSHEDDTFFFQTKESQYVMLAMDDGVTLLTHYDVQFSAVIEQASEFEGGSATFFMSYDTAAKATGHERAQALMFTPESIGWGDQSSSYAINTSEEHVYRLHAPEPGERATLFVDDAIALVRLNATLTSGIAFGDSSSAPGQDGDYQFSDVALVPRADLCPSELE